jgi:flagellar assembly protein FliH
MKIENYKPLVFEGLINELKSPVEYDSNCCVENTVDTANSVDINQLIELKREIEERISNLDVLERNAYERGYSAGEKAGYEMGIKKAEVVLSQLENLIKELENIKERYILENDKKIVALSIAIARKIIEKEIEESPETLLNMLHNAIKKIERQEKIKITINPAMQEIIERFKRGTLDMYPKISLDIDPNVSKDFIKVESDMEEIIINIEEELFEISKKLKELI